MKHAPLDLGPMPPNARMITLDRGLVRAPVDVIFALARDVERWPEHLPHYRRVTFRERTTDGGGVVMMSANRPFGPVNWPTWWTSDMQVHERAGEAPWIRFRHIGGITKGMDVLWNFTALDAGTHVNILHMWNGPPWPVIGTFVARAVIGPVFVHGIASRTLAGLARIAERRSQSLDRSIE